MKLRIATFNIENLDDRPDARNPSLAERLPFLKKALIRLDADILCLQEVNAQELPTHRANNPDRELLALNAVIADTQYQNYEIVSTKTTKNEPYDVRNLVILSKYRIIESQQLKNDLVGKLQYRKITELPVQQQAEDISWQRPIQYCKINHDQLGLLHVINVHLKSKRPTEIKGQKVDRFTWKTPSGWAEGFFLSSMKRVGQAFEVRAKVDEIFAENINANIIVCGDFNAEPGEVPIEAICGKVENTNNPELSRQALVPLSNGIADSVRHSHLHLGQGNLLDHILISQPLLSYFHRSEIHNEILHDESLPFSFDTKFPESDHAGFVSEFILDR